MMPKLNRKKPAAKPKTGKGTGKAGPSAKKTEKRQPQKAPKQREYAPKDLEDVLIGELLSGKEQHMEPRLFLQGLLYNSTESMRQLSYNYGFSIGKNLYSRTSKESIAPLLGVLESAGIGRMLYMPVIDTAIIKSSTRTPQEIEAKNNLHSYEAGLISGYLSAHSSNMIITLETHCMFNGAPFCQFVSNPADFHLPANSTFSLEQTVSNVIAAIDASGERVTGRPQIYALLSLLPIIKEPLLTESSKLMFLIGKKFAEDPRSRDTEKSLERLANFLDIQDVSVKREKKQTSVTLRYGSHNSMEGFMELSIKAFIGFLSKRFNSIVKVRESRFRRNYAVTLSITEGA